MSNLISIQPQGQAPISCPKSCGCLPVKLNEMCIVCDLKPIRITPDTTIPQSANTHIITSSSCMPQFHSNHLSGCICIPTEKNQMVSDCHRNGIRVEIKTGSITRLGVRAEVGYRNRMVIVYKSLHPIGANQSRRAVDT